MFIPNERNHKMEFTISLVEALQNAMDVGYSYVAFLSDFCFNQRDQTPYLVRASTLLKKIKDSESIDMFNMANGFNKFCLDLDLGVIFCKVNPESNFIMLYGGDAEPKIANFQNFMSRWESVTQYLLDQDSVETDYLGT
jgi:hypothetical protein